GIAENLVVRIPSVPGGKDVNRNASPFGKFECIGQQILQYLLQTALIRVNSRRQRSVGMDQEFQASVVRDLPECPLDIVAKVVEHHASDFHLHHSRFDLREIENFVDQLEKVRAGRIDGV